MSSTSDTHSATKDPSSKDTSHQVEREDDAESGSAEQREELDALEAERNNVAAQIADLMTSKRFTDMEGCMFCLQASLTISSMPVVAAFRTRKDLYKRDMINLQDFQEVMKNLAIEHQKFKASIDAWRAYVQCDILDEFAKRVDKLGDQLADEKMRSWIEQLPTIISKIKNAGSEHMLPVGEQEVVAVDYSQYPTLNHFLIKSAGTEEHPSGIGGNS